MPVTIDGEFVERNGKTYFNVKNVKSLLNLTHMKINVDNGFWAKAWTGPTNLALNSDWKILKTEIDKDPSKYIEIVNDILRPLLEQVAVEDVYES